MSAPVEEGAPPNPIAVRHRPSTGEWFVWSSFLEKPVSRMLTTKRAAEEALDRLTAKRWQR